jgi:hypothetical protein
MLLEIKVDCAFRSFIFKIAFAHNAQTVILYKNLHPTRSPRVILDKQKKRIEQKKKRNEKNGGRWEGKYTNSICFDLSVNQVCASEIHIDAGFLIPENEKRQRNRQKRTSLLDRAAPNRDTLITQN